MLIMGIVSKYCTCLILALILLFSVPGTAVTPNYIQNEAISYSSLDIEELHVSEINTTIAHGLPKHIHPLFRNNSFSKPLTFYVRFCLRTTLDQYSEGPITIFSIKYSYLQKNCTLSLQLGSNLNFVELCEKNKSSLRREFHSNLEQQSDSGRNRSKLFSIFIKTNPLSIQVCNSGANFTLPMFENGSNISLVSPEILLLDPESTTSRAICAISWVLINGQHWKHSCLKDNYTSCCLDSRGTS